MMPHYGPISAFYGKKFLFLTLNLQYVWVMLNIFATVNQ